LLTAVAAALSSGTQPPQLPGFLNSLAGPLGHYGLWAIALLVLVEDFGIPVPGETVLIAGAIYAGSGKLNVVAVGLVGFAAAVVGDNIGYAIGRFGGRALVERWGKYVFITPARLDKAEAFFEKHGGKIITIARFVEGLRQANGLIAGITGMHWLKFVLFNALGAALWVGTWVSIGYFAGQHITTIYHDITNYSIYAAIAAVVLIAVWVFLRVRRHRREREAEFGLAASRATAGEPAASGAQADTSTSTDADADAAAGPGATRAEDAGSPGGRPGDGAQPEPDDAAQPGESPDPDGHDSDSDASGHRDHPAQTDQARAAGHPGRVSDNGHRDQAAGSGQQPDAASQRNPGGPPEVLPQDSDRS
jgi:membrane protein DedA with SNARE-associated domain